MVRETEHKSRQDQGNVRTTIPTLIEPTSERVKDLRVWQASLLAAGFSPRWFITLTMADEHRCPLRDFLVELEQWIARLKEQPSVPGKVKASSEHLAALVAVGVPETHRCSRLHAHAVLFSNEGGLRWRHLAKTNKWKLGSITKFERWNPALGTGCFDYLVGHHALLPNKIHCHRPNRCRRRGCVHRHLDLPNHWFAGRLVQNSNETLNVEDDQSTTEDPTGRTAYLYQSKTGVVRPKPTNRPGVILRKRRNTNENNKIPA